jgi:hypothetical protein
VNHPPTPDQPNYPPWLPDSSDGGVGEGIKNADSQKAKKPKAEENKELEKKAEKKKVEQAESEKHKKTEEKEEKAKTKAEQELEKKQLKRIELVERSLHYKQLYEEIPPPRDPVMLTRLLIAEHIVALHEQITKPEDNAALNKDQLLDIFDYMGELSDKLEHPEEESTPNIQEAYDTLIVLATDATQEQSRDIPAVVQANKKTIERKIHKIHEEEGQSTLATPLSPAGAALIAALSYIRTPTPGIRTPILDSPGTSTRNDPVISVPSRSVEAPTHVSQKPTTVSSLSPVEARQAYREAPRSELGIRPMSRTPDRIASIAITAAVGSAYDRAPAPIGPEYTQPLTRHTPPPNHDQLIATTYSKATPTATHVETLHPLASPLSRPLASQAPSRTEAFPFSASADTDSHMSRKIEHLPLQSLLAMAETVSIGYGQRLRSAYEKGHIDKEGLIKVLKSRSKNNDFLREYKQQVTARRNLMQSSPEFLTPSTSKAPDTQADTAKTQPIDDPVPSGTTSNPTDIASLFSQNPNKAKGDRLAFAEDTSTGWRKVLIIAGAIAATITVLVLVFTLLSS